jgi:hypothetical protein
MDQDFSLILVTDKADEAAAFYVGCHASALRPHKNRLLRGQPSRA